MKAPGIGMGTSRVLRTFAVLAAVGFVVTLLVIGCRSTATLSQASLPFTTQTPSTATTEPTATVTSIPVSTATAASRSKLEIAEGHATSPFPLIIGNTVIADPARPSKTFLLHHCDVPGDCLPLQNQTLHVVLSPDDRRVLYEAFETEGVLHGTATPVPGTQVTPTLRLLDLQTGQDRLYVSGARGPVWGGDGQIAYSQGIAPAWTIGESYPSRVVVRQSLESSETIWASMPGDYACLAWAGPRLICDRAEHPQPNVTNDNLLAFTGPNRYWLLAPRFATLVAISPDGQRALVTSTYGQQDFRAVAYLVELSTGMELSALKLPASLENLAPDGQWSGEHIVSSIGISPGGTMHPAPTLAVLTVNGDQLTLAHVYTFGPRALLGGGPFAQVNQPRFIGGDLVHVGMLWGSRGYLDCHLDAATCLLGPDMAGRATFLANPSRPLNSSPLSGTDATP